MSNPLVAPDGKEIEDKAEGVFLKLITKYQFAFIGSLLVPILYMLIRIFSGVEQLKMDQVNTNNNLVRANDRIIIIEKEQEKMEAKVENINAKINAHEKESAQRWSDFLRGTEYGAHPYRYQTGRP